MQKISRTSTGAGLRCVGGLAALRPTLADRLGLLARCVVTAGALFTATMAVTNTWL